MVMYFPEHINIQKCDDGHTPLHIAVMANKLDIAHFLLAQVHVNLHLCCTYVLIHVHCSPIPKLSSEWPNEIKLLNCLLRCLLYFALILI